MSRVDVIVPCYKYAHFLRQCVESVLTQPVDLRVLIIDDASPDNTPEVAASLAAQDRRVEVRRHAVNQKGIATYNEGLEWATGDYTLLLSADDVLVPGALSRACRLLDRHPDVGFVYGKAIRFDSDHPLPPFRSAEPDCPWEIIPGIEWLKSICREGMQPIHSPEVVVRTSVQRELGGYRPELPHSGDMEMWMRFATSADVGVLEADQAFYRLHTANMSRQFTRNVTPLAFSVQPKEFRERKAAFDMLFRDNGHRLEDPDSLQWLADRGLAWNAFWTATREFEAGDLTSCQQFLDFALELYPELRFRQEWSRLQWKQWFGPRLWSVLGSTLALIRGARRRAPAQVF